MTLQFQFPKWPTFGEQEEKAVEDVVRSGQLFANQKVREFEESFGKYIGTEHALGLGNATQGLHLCLAALGIGIGDEVIVTPRTFLASATCCAWYGIKPVFVDVDENSQNITLETIKGAITNKTKAVVLVHLAGWPCELEEICKYCREKGIYIIEDCAQAHGVKYNDDRRVRRKVHY